MQALGPEKAGSQAYLQLLIQAAGLAQHSPEGDMIARRYYFGNQFPRHIVQGTKY